VDTLWRTADCPAKNPLPLLPVQQGNIAEDDVKEGNAPEKVGKHKNEAFIFSDISVVAFDPDIVAPSVLQPVLHYPHNDF
jgi:hypothetical protein